THGERLHDVDDTSALVLYRRIVDLHLQSTVGIKRRQVIEMNLVSRLLRLLEIDRVHLEQGKVPLTFLRAADMPLDGITSAQAEPPDLARAHIDVIRSRKVVGIRRAQKAESVLQNFHNALADYVDVTGSQALQDRKHQLLLTHRAGIFDL